MPKPRVLFLCAHNSARSQMAEAFLRQYAGDRFEVYSAGFEPAPIRPQVIQVMAEVGVDMSQHYAKGLDQFLGKEHFGYLITVCSDAEDKCPIFPGVSVRLHWPFPDPEGFTGTEEEKLVQFRQLRDQIAARIRSWLDEMS